MFAVFTAVFVACLGLGPVEEGDLFFRLAAGTRLLDGHGLVRTNLFSFTHPDAPYPDPAWLFDLGVAVLYRIAGFTAIVVAKAIILGFATGVAFARCRRLGVPPLLAALSLGAAGLLVSERFVERPHVVSLLGVALVGLMSDGNHQKRRWWIGMGLGTIVWLNFHAGAFLGPALVLGSALGALIDKAPSRPLFIAALVMTAALFVSPVGFQLLRYLYAHVGLFAVHPIDEFRSPSFVHDPGLCVFIIILVVSIGLAPRPWSRSLPVLGMAALTLSSVRFAAELAFVAVPVLSASWISIARRFRPVPTQERAYPRGLLLALAMAVVGWHLRSLPTSFAPPGGRFPEEALRFLDRHELREGLYNDFDLGGYMLWRDYPRHRVFVDPRVPAYPRSFHAVLGRTDLSRADWDKFLDSFGVKAALLVDAGINRRVSWFDPARWALVFRAHDSRIFVRRSAIHQPVIASFEIPASFRFSESEGTQTDILPVTPAGSPVTKVQWQLRAAHLALESAQHEAALGFFEGALAQTPSPLSATDEAEARAFVGASRLARAAYLAAVPMLERAVVLAPHDLATHMNLALALEGSAQKEKALAVWTLLAGVKTTPANAAIVAAARARILRSGDGRH